MKALLMQLMVFLLMAGVVVNDALVLVDHLNNLTKGSRGNNIKNIKALIASGTADRLRPVILTTLTTNVFVPGFL